MVYSVVIREACNDLKSPPTTSCTIPSYNRGNIMFLLGFYTASVLINIVCYNNYLTYVNRCCDAESSCWRFFPSPDRSRSNNVTRSNSEKLTTNWISLKYQFRDAIDPKLQRKIKLKAGRGQMCVIPVRRKQSSAFRTTTVNNIAGICWVLKCCCRFSKM